MSQAQEKEIPLTLEAMKRGGVLSQINEALHKCLKDIAQRPEITKARTLSVKFTIKPGESGPPWFPTLEYTIEPKIPCESGGAFSAIQNRNGEFLLPAAAYEQQEISNVTPLNNAAH